jgi:hypothetical protein
MVFDGFEREWLQLGDQLGSAFGGERRGDADMMKLPFVVVQA